MQQNITLHLSGVSLAFAVEWLTTCKQEGNLEEYEGFDIEIELYKTGDDDNDCDFDIKMLNCPFEDGRSVSVASGKVTVSV